MQIWHAHTEMLCQFVERQNTPQIPYTCISAQTTTGVLWLKMCSPSQSDGN